MVNDMKTDETLEQFTDRVYFEGGEPIEGMKLLEDVLKLDRESIKSSCHLRFKRYSGSYEQIPTFYKGSRSYSQTG